MSETPHTEKSSPSHDYVSSKTSAVMKHPSASSSPSLKGRLIGWLVSYGLSDRGVSYEIRVGRSLVGKGASSDSHRDVKIDQGELSSPHLAVSASPDHEVLVQDVFSERGSFLVKHGSSKEVPLSGPTPLGHGDWIRLGDDVRFQLCLIDGARS
jgi:hypothetical protein